MNDVPTRPRPPDEPGGADDAPAGPELASVPQTQLPPTERRFGEALPTDGPNGQSSTPLRVPRRTDPGATPGLHPTTAPLGDDEVADRGRGVPDIHLPHGDRTEE